MHDTAMQSGAAFFEVYLAGGNGRILDVGSADFNGSLRSVKPEGAEYVGVDIQDGPGVDMIVGAGDPLPFEADAFDVVVSTSCFEHDPMFWSTFLQMARVVRPGGHIYISSPSNGPYHSYPGDNWRFYPDCGLALAEWARRQGYPMRLIESGTLMRVGDIWNDFVAIFQKTDDPAPQSRFALDAFPDAENVRRFDTEEVRGFSEQPQDLRFLRDTREALARTEAELRQARHEAAEQADLIARQAHALKVATEDIAVRDEVIAQRTQQVRERESHIELVKAELAERDATIRAIYGSTSWKATRPLRWLRRKVG